MDPDTVLFLKGGDSEMLVKPHYSFIPSVLQGPSWERPQGGGWRDSEVCLSRPMAMCVLRAGGAMPGCQYVHD